MKIKLLALMAALSLTNCKKDPCGQLDCYNGGYCDDGKCVCPTGYVGKDCYQFVMPSKITITTISIHEFPMVNNDGNEWDTDGAPDLYVALEEDSQFGEVFNNRQSVQINTLAAPISWTLSDFTMEQTSNRFGIKLYDFEDFGGDEVVGYIYFKPFDKVFLDGFPSSKFLGCIGCEISCTIGLKYEF